ALLSDPAVLVMFDEADVAARRDGWDAARWVRHLAAKLHGHGDVLPPGGESEDTVHPVPGGLPERAFDPESIDIGAMADAAQDLAADVPRADDFDALPEDRPAGFSGLVAAEDMDWSSAGGDELSLADDPALAELIASAHASGEGIGRDADGADDSVSGLDGGSTFDTAGLPLAEESDAPSGDKTRADSSAPARDPLSLGDGLSLADDDAPLATREPVGTIDLDALGSRLDGISLADPDSYGHGQLRGAVVVEAGLGGPDAVRQLLGGLVED